MKLLVVLVVMSGVVIGSYSYRERVSQEKAILEELSGLRRDLSLAREEEAILLTYDKLASGHYKVVVVQNEYDGTALVRGYGPHGYVDRIVRKMPLGLMVSGREFSISYDYAFPSWASSLTRK
ncbi:MAG: hypothetical protein WC531_00370 [Candidatus Paceibacterota bacterium]|jgi:hypothetical protein